MNYIVISRCEDGPITQVMTAGALKQALKEEFADFSFIPDLKGIRLETFPSRSLLIIKGEVIMPKPRQVTVEYEL